ncbi:hypothetical protein C8Q80DRAFT_1175968 [Daedaleopsis nitida]|nr:hypothetical protein C8Q80DRAFT_1175968 [Daedaleopsis nitida]
MSWLTAAAQMCVTATVSSFRSSPPSHSIHLAIMRPGSASGVHRRPFLCFMYLDQHCSHLSQHDRWVTYAPCAYVLLSHQYRIPPRR